MTYLDLVVVGEAHEDRAQLLHGRGERLLDRLLVSFTDAADARQQVHHVRPATQPGISIDDRQMTRQNKDVRPRRANTTGSCNCSSEHFPALLNCVYFRLFLQLQLWCQFAQHLAYIFQMGNTADVLGVRCFYCSGAGNGQTNE